MSSQWLWYASRGTGVVSAVLLTMIAILGMWTSAARSRRPYVNASAIVLHRLLALGMTVFLAVHIVTAVVDSYVSIGWISAFVPFTSGYERAWVGLGAIALDILLAVIVTSLLRQRMTERAWKAVHLTAYAMTPIALVHGFAMGTDNQPLLRYTPVVCAVLIGMTALWRFTGSSPDRARRLRAQVQEWS